MGAVPAQALACGTWSPPDVLGVRGYSGKRPWRVRQPMMAMTKTELRRLARARRKQFVADRGSALFPTHAAHMADLLGLLSPQICIAGYCAMPNEADISALLMQIEGHGAALALPWIGAQGQDMLFRRWSDAAPLNIAADKFLQPLSTADQVAPDIILMPVLGFDRQGTRLGQGAGYYDRALARQSDPLRIGVAWSVQEFESLPADPWDMPLDAILTEAEWIIPDTSRCAKER